MTTTNITGTSPITPTYTAPAGGSGVTLTPDDLIAYCATQLNGMDSQIQGQLTAQNSERNAQSLIAGLQQSLTPFAPPSKTGIDPTDGATKESVLNQFKAIYDALPPGSTARADVQTAFDNFRDNACFNDNYGVKTSLDSYTPAMAAADASNTGATADSGNKNQVAPDEVATTITNLGTISTSVGNDADVEMVSLQSLVSQRQTAVQLCTNLMSKLDDTLNSVVQNLKS